ncbi:MULTISPECIES: hypothetical protein [Caldilinea]|uniref:hypothetical protein n=1 Tax=Caldilinea TaxID=233191 RepID=UPI0005C466CC|nr:MULTISPECIES: hypothetical protein [Caldilinea]MBO9393970.1 hypothetical protein [Caldilinea sp.]
MKQLISGIPAFTAGGLQRLRTNDRPETGEKRLCKFYQRAISLHRCGVTHATFHRQHYTLWNVRPKV